MTNGNATVAQIFSQTFNGRVEQALPGGYFKILTAAANLQVELWEAGVLRLLAPTVKAGFYQRVSFDRIVFVNTGAQLVECLIAPDEGGSDAISGSFTLTGPWIGAAHTPAAKTAGAASAQILAANANRKYLAIQNQSATEDAYIHTAGGAAVVSNASFKVRPGETWEPPVVPVGAIFAIRGAAADALLHVIEA